MKLLIQNFFSLLFLLLLSTWINYAHAQESYTDIEWIQLLPEDDLIALLSPPEFLNDIPDGSIDDNINNLTRIGESDETATRFEQALKSTEIVNDFENKNIRLPGFIVPISSNESMKVTNFFIVPYFGACLHMPPPPPNQIIYVHYEQGIELSSLYDAFFFEGKLLIDTTENELGTAAYTMKIQQIYPYSD